MAPLSRRRRLEVAEVGIKVNYKQRKTIRSGDRGVQVLPVLYHSLKHRYDNSGKLLCFNHVNGNLPLR